MWGRGGLKVGGGQGGPNLPSPITYIPSSCTYFLSFLPLALFPLPTRLKLLPPTRGPASCPLFSRVPTPYPPPLTYKGMLKILKLPLHQTSTIVICNKINTIKIPAGYHHSCTTFRQHFYHSFSQTCTTPGNKSRLALEAVFG